MIDWLYNYLTNHEPYNPMVNRIRNFLFKKRIDDQRQITKLNLQLWLAKKKARYIANALIAAEKNNELGFNRALQLVGILKENPKLDFNEAALLIKVTNENTNDASLNMSDAEFEALMRSNHRRFE